MESRARVSLLVTSPPTRCCCHHTLFESVLPIGWIMYMVYGVPSQCWACGVLLRGAETCARLAN